MTYYIQRIFKDVDLDNYNEGIIAGITNHAILDLNFFNPTIKGLISEVSEFINSDDYIIDPCDDDHSAIEWHLHENEHGTQATDEEMKQWKEGKIDLYQAIYRVYVKKLEDVNISEELAKEARS